MTDSEILVGSIITKSTHYKDHESIQIISRGSVNKVKIEGAQDAASQLRQIWDNDVIELKEEFFILLLNQYKNTLGWAKISSGGVSGTVCDPKIIFQIALISNASSIILSHNHPSGNTTPSAQDLSMTKKMVEAGRLLDIYVIDHIIMTRDNYYSLAEHNQI